MLYGRILCGFPILILLCILIEWDSVGEYVGSVIQPGGMAFSLTVALWSFYKIIFILPEDNNSSEIFHG
jgi:hypothetical protein